MASVVNRPNGLRWIQFTSPDGKRQTLRLGKCDRKAAESVARHVEALLEARITGTSVRPATAVWLSSIGEVLRDKLVSCGLLDRRETTTLGKLTDAFLKAHKSRAKPASVVVLSHTIRNLLECFGRDTPVRKLKAEDGERFRLYLVEQKLADTTINKRLSFGRQILRFGNRMGWVEGNFLEGVTHRAGDAGAKRIYVPIAVIERVLEECPDAYWRLLVALGRFNGLRIPSEALSLRWRDVDWQRGRLTVTSPKTEGRGKPFRVVPLFPMTRRYLEEVYELAPAGSEWVFPESWRKRAQGPNGWLNANFRARFLTILRRAGVEAWPRPWHSLRSSCVSDLVTAFPLTVVIKWMGHTAGVSLRHYVDTLDREFERAASWRPEGEAKSEAQAKQNAKPREAAEFGKDTHALTESLSGWRVMQQDAKHNAWLHKDLTERTGFEPAEDLSPSRV